MFMNAWFDNKNQTLDQKAKTRQWQNNKHERNSVLQAFYETDANLTVTHFAVAHRSFSTVWTNQK